MAGINEFSVKEAQNLIIGRVGSNLLNDTSVHTGKWFAITIISDAIFTTLTSSNLTGSTTGITFPAGIQIYGDFTTITLTSGTVLAYKVA